MANLRANRITSTEVFETTGSVQFDGSGDYLSASSSDFAFGTGDFTIEFLFLRFNSGNNVGLLDTRASNVDNNGWFVRFNSSSTIQFVDNVSQYATVTYNTSEWNHIAFVRNSSTITTFLNGISVSVYPGATKNYTSSNFLIGGFVDTQSSPNAYQGHISNLRVLKGQALYTENFTPPTRELEVIPNTVLLACQSTTNAAEEKTGKTITVNGNAVANELTPGLLTNVVKSGGSSAITGSVEFDGTGDFSQIVRGSNTDFEFGTQDFTIEFFAHFAKTGMRIMSTGDNGNYNTGGWVFETNNQFGVRDSGGSFTYYGTFAYPTNSWAHISVVRNGSNIYGFVNGIQQWSNTITANITFSGTNDFSLGTGRSGSSGLGDYNLTASVMTKGFISNLRILKGTALYTSNFIPPTRKLTKLPGTVLLCCQDSNNPTQEATGKTITPYGSLDRQDTGIELVTNGTFDTNLNGWTLSASTPPTWASGGYMQFNSDGLTFSTADQSITTKIGSSYKLSFTQVANANQIYVRVGTTQGAYNLINELLNPPVNGITYSYTFVATTTTTWIQFSDGSNSANQQIDNVSVTKLDPGPKPPFVPQIGSDGSVVFDGTTKINTPNYFHLPTGPTEQRGRGRGVFGGGTDISTTNTNILDFVNIQSSGVSQDFGDLSAIIQDIQGCSSSIRGIFAGGQNPGGYTSNIEHITISSQGNSTDFGADLSNDNFMGAMCSSSTRGLYGGGILPPSPTILAQIDYLTISSLGTVSSFGNLFQGRFALTSFSSPTRGIFAGGATPTVVNTIDYVTISSTGNAQDFGDISDQTKRNSMGAASQTRGLIASGYNPSATNAIHYITISSTGNSQDFGDLNTTNYRGSGSSNSVRGIFAGGYIIPSVGVNTIDYVTISSTGNALDFGDLYVARNRLGTSASDSHGGLG